MHLRWRLAVVTGAGAGLGREVAVRLARAGAGVLVVDEVLSSAEAVAVELRERRVSAWAIEADATLEDDVSVVAARARDLGGADLLVDTSGAPHLLAAFLQDVGNRRGRNREPGVAVCVGTGPVVRTETARVHLVASHVAAPEVVALLAGT